MDLSNVWGKEKRFSKIKMKPAIHLMMGELRKDWAEVYMINYLSKALIFPGQYYA
jgi:hypothetical protein